MGQIKHLIVEVRFGSSW